MNPYVLLAAGVLWLASVVGAFRYGEHVREAELVAAALAQKEAKQGAADAAAIDFQRRWDSDRAAGAALDEEVSLYATTDASRAACFDDLGLQLFNALATGVPVPGSGSPAVLPRAAEGAGRDARGDPRSDPTRSR